jgi:hypothetical protein
MSCMPNAEVTCLRKCLPKLDGKGWDGTGWNGMGWDEMGQDGMAWDGMG